MKTCSSCDRELDADSRFCDGCGAVVQGAATPDSGEAARKTVTALFCDLVGSTALGEQVDAESTRDAMGRYHAMARSVIESHGGTVAKFIGDGVMALFGVPEVGPDDADRAVRAGVALQVGFGAVRNHIEKRHGMDVGLRVGINTGEVVIDAADADIVGDAFNTAARLEAACAPGGVLVGESTYRLTRSSIDFAEGGEIEAKGKDEPVLAFEVVAAHTNDHEDDLTTPFVGREDELRRLRVVLEDTILERRAALVTVVGSPGVGKTRLARELRAAVEGGTRSFELRCERAGNATFAPIAELLRDAAGITDSHSLDEMIERVGAVVSGTDDAERVGDLLCGFLGAGPVRSTEEMFFAARRLVETLGGNEPVVLVVDDVQWAEPLLLDLLEHLAEWVQTVPLLVVCLARPEIRDVRAALAEKGRRVAEVVNLEGLSTEATGELAAKLVGADALPQELLNRIPESTEGNPLFVRELMRMLVGDGVISDASGRWEMAIDVDALEVPPTINSLLASRVERMPAEERRVLELASVVGSEFPIGAVEAAGNQTRHDLGPMFERLRRKELIEPTGSYWGDEPVYRFHHVLIRDAAYRRLLKGARADLHTAVGEWTERTAASLVGEHDVTVAHHFEQAHHYRRELDLDDDRSKELGEQAATLFHAAAARALEREDLAAAGSLAKRALDCVGDDNARIAELLLLGCEAVLGVGNVSDGAPLVDRLASVAGDDPRLQAWVDCFRVQLAVFTDPEGIHDAERLADDAARRLAELDDQAGVAKARIQRAGALVRLARVGDCEAELDRALTAARAVDDRRRVTAVLGSAPIAALWGPSPVPRAGGRCLDVVRLLRITTGSPAVEATSIRCQAVLEALRDRFDTARSMLDTARSKLEELGLTHDLLETEFYAGLVELLANEPDSAEPLLRTAHEGLGRMGIGADRGQAAAHLARALLLQGRLDEAEQLVLESADLAGQNLQTVIVSRAVHAEILSAQGRHDEALATADEAVTRAADSDILIDHANAVAAQARVRAAAGDTAGAGEAAQAANALYDLKGATVRADLGQTKATTTEAVESTTAIPDIRSDGPDPMVEESMAPSNDGAWNRADELTRAWAATSDVAELLTADVDFEDRRRLVAEPGHDRLVLAGMSDNVSLQHVDRVETVAVRGDLLSVHRMTWHSDDGTDLEWELLTLAEFSDDGHPARTVVFESEQLDEALARLDEWYVEALPDDEARVLRIAWECFDAYSEHDRSRLDQIYADECTLLDNRHGRQNFGEIGKQEWLERSAAIWRVSETVRAFTSSIPRVDSTGLVMTGGMMDASGNRWDIISIVLVRDGLIVRNEFFDPNDLERALARFEQLCGSVATSTVEPWSEADRVARQLIEAQFLRDFDRWDLRTHEHMVVRDHRSGSQSESSEKASAIADYWDASAHPWPVMTTEIETIAVRGEELVLHHVMATTADGSDVSADWLGLNRVIDGRSDLAVLFDGDDLRQAVEELDRLYCESLPLVDALNFDAAIVRPYRDLTDGELERFIARLHPDYMIHERRPLGFADSDLAAAVERIKSIAEVADSFLAMTERVHVLDEYGAVHDVRYVLETKEGSSLTQRFSLFNGWAEMGGLIHSEQFDEGEHARAFEAYDTWRGSQSIRPDATLASTVARTLNMEMWPPQPRIGPFVVDQDRFLSDEHNPFGCTAGRVLATAGDHLALLEMQLDDDSWAFVLIEVDETARLTDWRVFAADQLREAMSRSHHRFTELTDDETLLVTSAFAVALSNDDARALDATMADDFVSVDHRKLGFPALTRHDQLAAASALSSTTTVLVPVEILRSAPGVALSRIVFYHGQAGALLDSIPGLSVLQVREGRVGRVDMFADDDLDAALARFDELAARTLATSTSQENRSPDLVNTSTRLANQRDSRAETAVLAVRGDRLALLLHLGDELPPQLRIVSLSPTGDIHVEKFGPSELAAACDRLNQRYLLELGDEAPPCFKAMAEFDRVSRDASQLEQLEAILADDLTGESYEVLAQISGQTKADMITMFASTADLPGQMLTRKIHAVADHIVVVSVASVAGLETGALTENLIVNLVVEHDGKIVRLDQWEMGDLDLALARFDELTAAD